MLSSREILARKRRKLPGQETDEDVHVLLRREPGQAAGVPLPKAGTPMSMWRHPTAPGVLIQIDHVLQEELHGGISCIA